MKFPALRAASLAAAAGIVLVRCASYGDPGPIGRYGYTVERLDRDEYRITYAGPPDMPLELRLDYLLYGAASVAVKNDGDHFVILDETLKVPFVRSVQGTRESRFGYQVIYSGGDRSDLSGNAGAERQAHQLTSLGISGVSGGGSGPGNLHESQVVIRLGKGVAPPAAIDARVAYQELSAKYAH